MGGSPSWGERGDILEEIRFVLAREGLWWLRGRAWAWRTEGPWSASCSPSSSKRVGKAFLCLRPPESPCHSEQTERNCLRTEAHPQHQTFAGLKGPPPFHLCSEAAGRVTLVKTKDFFPREGGGHPMPLPHSSLCSFPLVS